MAAIVSSENNPSPSSGAIHLLLRVYFPAAFPSSPVQPFEHGIQLPIVTTVAALLNHIQLRCIPVLPASEYLDPDSLHIVWKPGLNRANTPLHDRNVRIEMANVWSHGGGDVLVVRIKERRGSEASEGGAGAAMGDHERMQAEFNKREEFKRRVHEKIATDALHLGSSSSAAATNPSRQDETASMEDVRFTGSNASSPHGHSLQQTVKIEQEKWGGATLTNPVPRRAHSHAGSDMFAGASGPNASSPIPAGRGGEPSSVPMRPGFWRADGGWDSEAAARAHGPAAPSSGFSAEPSRRIGRGRLGSVALDLPVIQNPHVWSEDTLGDRPQNLENGPPIKTIKSIFPRTAGERNLSQSRHAPAGRQGRGVQGQNRPDDNRGRARVQGGDGNWVTSSQQPSQNPPPHPGWRNPNPIPHQSQPQNRDSSTRQPNLDWDAQDQSQDQSRGGGHVGKGEERNRGEGEDQSFNWGGPKSPKGRW